MWWGTVIFSSALYFLHLLNWVCCGDYLFSKGGLNAKYYGPREANSKPRRTKRKVTHLHERVTNCFYHWFPIYWTSKLVSGLLCVECNQHVFKNNRALFTQIFPRLGPFTCICFQFCWLVLLCYSASIDMIVHSLKNGPLKGLIGQRHPMVCFHGYMITSYEVECCCCERDMSTQ